MPAREHSKRFLFFNAWPRGTNKKLFSQSDLVNSQSNAEFGPEKVFKGIANSLAQRNHKVTLAKENKFARNASEFSIFSATAAIPLSRHSMTNLKCFTWTPVNFWRHIDNSADIWNICPSVRVLSYSIRLLTFVYFLTGIGNLAMLVEVNRFDRSTVDMQTSFTSKAARKFITVTETAIFYRKYLFNVIFPLFEVLDRKLQQYMEADLINYSVRAWKG